MFDAHKFDMRAEKAVNNLYIRYQKVYRVKFVHNDTLPLAMQSASSFVFSERNHQRTSLYCQYISI